MRGGFLHNRVLLAPLERMFSALGSQISREHFVCEGTRNGAIDLFVRLNGWLISCEAETGTRRVKNDVWKAHVAHADLLIVITPNSRVAKACRKALRSGGRIEVPSNLIICVLPLGPALQRLNELLSFSDRADCQPVRNHKIGPVLNLKPLIYANPLA